MLAPQNPTLPIIPYSNGRRITTHVQLEIQLIPIYTVNKLGLQILVHVCTCKRVYIYRVRVHIGLKGRRHGV